LKELVGYTKELHQKKKEFTEAGGKSLTQALLGNEGAGPIMDYAVEVSKAGDKVEISGIMYTGRDAAHKRLVELLANNKPLPIDVNGSAIYYVGPTPAKPGRAIGSAGPTSSYRMDAYSEPLMQQGLKIMIGKGPRSKEYKEMLKKYSAVYISAIGGAAAAISESIIKCDLVCYEDLGAEAIYRLEIKDFFGIVTYDVHGNDLFLQEIEKYKQI
jgi:fumarate hydratase subunit beta